MGRLQLRINQRMGQIGSKRVPGYFRINSNPVNIKINYGTKNPLQVMDEIEIEKPPVKLEIDQSKPREELNFRDFNAFTKYSKQEAAKKMNQGVKEIVSEGDTLANNISKDGKMIAQLAKKELTEDKDKFAIKAVPKSAPEVNVKDESIEIRVPNNRIKVETTGSVFPEIKGKGDEWKIYLAQKGKFEIEVVGQVIDYKG